MKLEEKFELIARNTVEIVTKEELLSLLEEVKRPRAYWGFECSGYVHLGMALICGAKIKDMIKAGFEFIVLLADWHSWINDKLGGDFENIRKAGEFFKHCFNAIGIKPEDVRYVWTSELVSDPEYWRMVIQIAKETTLRRAIRALPIMGRSMDSTEIPTSWIYYPCMQVADMFYLNIDVACAGIDQRKAHMLAREVAKKLKWKTPICLHTPLLMGLSGVPSKGIFDEEKEISAKIGSKMSKSMPDTCIFIHESVDSLQRKIRNAFCPPKVSANNPVLEIAKLIIFPLLNKLRVERPRHVGGMIEFSTYSELELAYEKGEVHPLDLKNAVAEALIDLLKPVREYFEKHPEPLEEMIKIEKSITR